MKHFFRLICAILIIVFGLTSTGAAAALSCNDRAALNVVVSVINDNNGGNTAADFTIRVTGANPSVESFPGSSTGTEVLINAHENYKISVATLSYSVSYSPNCVSVLAPDDVAVCDIVLNDLAPLAEGENPPNLINNPSFESVSEFGEPEGWFKGGYGNNDRVLTYPVDGVGGGSAVNIKITSYADGDAKWYFSVVPVMSGHSYNFTNDYICDTDSELAVEYFDSNYEHFAYGGFYQMLPTPIDIWKTSNASFVVPEGAAFMTVFHNLKSVGNLTIDNASLTEEPLPEPFDKGFVSLSFDDGFKSQYDIVKPKLDEAGMKGTFYLISHAQSGFSILNPSFEIASGTEPSAWGKTGLASSTFIYPTVGRNQSVGAQVKSTEIESNAGWYFNPTGIIADHIYSFSEWYNSTAESELVALITNKDGMISQAQVLNSNGDYLGDSVILSSSEGVWKQVNAYYYAPEDAKSITAFIRLRGVGELTVDDVSLGIESYMAANEVSQLEADGHEVGAHTQTHPDLSSLPIDEAEKEILGCRSDLSGGGIGEVVSFDYPYGIYNDNIKKIVEKSNYTSGRTVAQGYNGKDSNRYTLFSKSVNASTTIAQVGSWIDLAKADRAWLILTFHDISSSLDQKPYGSTPEMFQSIVDYLKNRNVPVKKVSEGVLLLNDSLQPRDSIAPVISLKGDSFVSINYGEIFIDPGATGSDDVDGDISHKVTLSGDVITIASSPGTYQIYYDVTDAAGNKATQVMRTVIILRAPLKITGAAGRVSENKTVISWKTDLPSYGRVIYDIVSHSDSNLESAPNYGYQNSSIENSELTTEHEFTINNLSLGETYYFRPISRESEETIGPEISIYIPKQEDDVPNPDPQSSGGATWIFWSKPLIKTAVNSNIERNKKAEIEIKKSDAVVNYQYKNLYKVAPEIVEAVSDNEAKAITTFTGEIKSTGKSLDLFNKIIEGKESLPNQNQKNAIRFFIEYGTQTTSRIGMGERAGVLNSYSATFNRFPESIDDWKDVIKIANGHWPQSKNESAEKQAHDKYFKTIYKRSAQNENPYDNAAVSIICYGLRPVSRNMESEKAAVNTFRSVYRNYPKSAIEWDIVRAIAYSGAKR